jgi:hypothetical protein
VINLLYYFADSLLVGTIAVAAILTRHMKGSSSLARGVQLVLLLDLSYWRVHHFSPEMKVFCKVLTERTHFIGVVLFIAYFFDFLESFHKEISLFKLEIDHKLRR